MICVDRTGSVCDSNDLQGTCLWTISNTLGGGLHHTYSELRVVLGVVLEKQRVMLNDLEVFINHQGFSFLS